MCYNGAMPALRTLTPTIARRLAIAAQRLAGSPPPATAAGILETVRALGCLQLDPTNVVARSHLLVLWSRLGAYDRAALDTLLWEERRLFEYWAHCASIVLTEHYPIHQAAMRASHQGAGPWPRRVRAWMEANAALRDHIVGELQARGPLPAARFEDRAVEPWPSSGWTAGRNVDRMLTFLWMEGRLTVAGRTGTGRVWDLAERWFPADTPRDVLPPHEVVARAAQVALRALGVAQPAHIENHFIRESYPGLPGVLADLQAAGHIVPVAIAGDDGGAWPGPWYIHTADLPLLDRLEAGEWTPRTTLLSPFDNLICDRARTERLFDFRFRIEIYVPRAQREYGYYVLPILHGDRLIGRLDPVLDRRRKSLTINAVYAEPAAPQTAETGAAVAGAVADLAAWIGATEVVYGDRLPAGWAPALRPEPLASRV